MDEDFLCAAYHLEDISMSKKREDYDQTYISPAATKTILAMVLIGVAGYAVLNNLLI